ncbi:hypothetical protein GGF31_005461 [Allomyces arbusculus]|nr:hypothetical protein GGF31_005461 [Allomyces arbusculus]
MSRRDHTTPRLAPLIALLALCLLTDPIRAAAVDVRKCNGLASICTRPFFRTTFPGAHNVGTDALTCTYQIDTCKKSLTAPKTISDMSFPDGPRVTAEFAARAANATAKAGTQEGLFGCKQTKNTCTLPGLAIPCGFKCQDRSVTGLLDVGIRWLDMDFCGFFPGALAREPFSCHAGPKLIGTAYGRPAAQAFADIGAWVSAHPNDLVVIYLSDQKDFDAAAYAQLSKSMTDAFGAYLYSGTPAQLKAAHVGDLLAQNVRVVVTGKDAWVSDLPQMPVQLLDIIDSYSHDLSPVDPTEAVRAACAKADVDHPVLVQAIGRAELGLHAICINDIERGIDVGKLLDMVPNCPVLGVIKDYAATSRGMVEKVATRNQAVIA